MKNEAINIKNATISAKHLPINKSFSGKEKQTVRDLGWLDFSARMYANCEMPIFTTQDPLAEKYYSVSPYIYCMNNPVRFIDPNGDSVRIYTETTGFGHSWVSVGEGNEMVIYSYGRYNGTNKGQDGSSNSLSNGSGVLLRLTGEEAKNYNEEKLLNTEMSTYVVTDVTDEQIATVYDEMFNSSTKMPDKGKYANNSSAHVIDEYKLFSNNCTTIVEDVLKETGSKVMNATQRITNRSLGESFDITVRERFIKPSSLQSHLNYISKNKKEKIVYKTK
jgi:RHS repeat-associated protein